MTGNRTPRPFPVGAAVDYQLGGGYPVPDGVGIVVRDRSDRPEPDGWSVCYVNGFQTQPDEAERWEGANAELLLTDRAGRPVSDPDWPDEHLLDTSTRDRRQRIARIIGADLRQCAERGFDAVEIDNLDSFTRAPTRRAPHRISLADNEALARLYATRAHGLGLLVGQKNTAEHAARLRRGVGFDFAVAEECVAHDECQAYTDAYGGAVLDVEYTDEGLSWRAVCAERDRPVSIVLRDRDLLPAGRPGHVVRRC